MPRKRYVAIICEYNPFHYGHLFQIESLKKEYDGVVCIMSGNFVQRGELSIADKYLRAKSAVLCGADLVLELPFPYCMMSARDFANAGVIIAHRIGADALGFGCEDSFLALTEISDLLETNSFKESLSTLIKTQKTLSFPKATELLVTELLGVKYGEIIRKPNNILTLEYLSAIKRNSAPLIPHPVIRDITLRPSSYIRSRSDKNEILSLLPDCSAEVFRELSEESFPNTTENLSQFIIGTLRGMPKDPDKDYYGTPADLYHIVRAKAETTASFYSLTESCQNNLYTSARVRRSILSIIFGITGSMSLCKPSFTSLLAANSTGRAFLANRKKSLKINILTKPAHINRLPNTSKEEFLFMNKAESIVSLVKNPSSATSGSSFSSSTKSPCQKSPYIID